MWSQWELGSYDVGSNLYMPIDPVTLIATVIVCARGATGNVNYSIAMAEASAATLVPGHSNGPAVVSGILVDKTNGVISIAAAGKLHHQWLWITA